MGNTASSPSPSSQSPSPIPSDETKSTSVEKTVSQSKCPMKSSTSSSATSSDSTNNNDGTNSSIASSLCPMKYKNPKQYNVYSQEIDPTNQMPATPHQATAPGQSTPLDTHRVKSSIPKGGTDDQTWVYPSPQMFWNALVRKEKADGASEIDMNTVVSIHNNMNENTWKQILAWENLHPTASATNSATTASAINSATAAVPAVAVSPSATATVTPPSTTPFSTVAVGTEPKLLRFMGKPNDLSPKARIKMWFGHHAPFDRHDWVVDRGGQEVRYIIDYYHDESQVGTDTLPTHIHDTKSIQSIQVDVRPALDSFESLFDRVFIMPLQRRILHNASVNYYNPPPFFMTKPVQDANKLKLQTLNQQWSTIQNQCQNHKEALLQCGENQEKCMTASLALQRCTANVVCPKILAEFDACLATTNNPKDNKKDEKTSAKEDDKLSMAYSNIEICLENFKLESLAAKSSIGGTGVANTGSGANSVKTGVAVAK